MLVLLIPTIGILLYFALFIVALVVGGTFWVLGNLVLWLSELKPRLTGRKSRPKSPPKAAASAKRKIPRSPAPAATEAQDASDIWPKWTASRRRDADRERALWQEQFDALNSRE